MYLETALALAAGLLTPATPTPPLVDVAGVDPRFVIDIRYATPNNFFRKKVYPEARCLVRPSVADKLVRAQRWLDEHQSGLRLMFKDCYRPKHVQNVLWAAVEGTPKERYVANPNGRTGSIHAYGAAVDVTLADASGAELDMGTEYDHLGPLAEPRHEHRFLREGKLTDGQVKSRKILRRAMRFAGFLGLRNEWWHFNALPAKKVRLRFKPLDIPFSSIPRPPNAETSSRPFP